MNNEQREFATSLLDFVNRSPSAFHAAANCLAALEQSGCILLRENEPWNLRQGGRYCVMKNGSGLIAFTVGTGDLAGQGFRIIGAHTDSPCFKLKPGSAFVSADGYVSLNTEAYGGMILHSWFDRPLSLAGRVILNGDGPASLVERLCIIDRPILIIPNLCIHLNRTVNEGAPINRQTDVPPLLGLAGKGLGKADYLPELLAQELGVDKRDIIDYDLFLYEWEKGLLMGREQEFVSASRLDNLSMVFNALQAFLTSDKGDGLKVFAAFDNEEVGSLTAPGADSAFLPQVLRRISSNLGLQEEQWFMALANSMAISADTAHAVHPNYSAKHDPENRPVLGKGPVIKYSAAQKYATTALSAAFFAKICQEAGVPCQKYANRSDIPGGSTIGPALSSLLSIRTVDVGTPILAMHSIREFGCVADNFHTVRAFQTFYELKLSV